MMSAPDSRTPSDEALEYITSRLTPQQRALLVGSLVRSDPDAEQVLVDGNQKVINALQREPSPLVGQEGARRYLTPLGAAVARYINRTDRWRSTEGTEHERQ